MNNLIGKRVNVKSKPGDSAWNAEYGNAWGTIVYFDGDLYHVQLFCCESHPTSATLVLERSEFVITRNQNKGE